jgi:hypothetical protein
MATRNVPVGTSCLVSSSFAIPSFAVARKPSIIPQSATSRMTFSGVSAMHSADEPAAIAIYQ